MSLPTTPRRVTRSAAAVALMLLATCAPSPAPDTARNANGAVPGVATTAQHRPPVVIDSVRPIADHLARFRGADPAPAVLDGTQSRERLVRSAVSALARRDTVAIRSLMIDRAEFAYLFYPFTRLAQPPYEMPPDLLWMQLTMRSEKGLRKAIGTLPASRLRYAGHQCERTEREGENVLHQLCAVRLADGATVVLFGSILERGGRFKLVSWANSL